MRHNRITASISKDPKLERLIRDILAEVRASRVQSSATVKAARTAHGTSLEVLQSTTSEPSVQKSYVVKSETFDRLVCRTWNGTSEGDTDVTVYKPDELVNQAFRACYYGVWQIRANPLQLTVNSVPATSANKRFMRWENTVNSLLNQAYKEVIYPPYVQNPVPPAHLATVTDNVPDLQFVIYAAKDDAGRLVDTNSGRWRRAWHKEVVVCTKQGNQLALIPSSHVYDAPLDFSTL